MSDKQFSFAVKLDGLGMTAVINCTSNKQRIQFMREVGKFTELLTTSGVTIDISKCEEEAASGDLH